MSNELTGRNVGKTCRVHYKGTFNDGKQFDSSYDRGGPLEFVCGAGQMIKGFDAAVADLEVGAEVDSICCRQKHMARLTRRLFSPCRLPSCRVPKT